MFTPHFGFKVRFFTHQNNPLQKISTKSRFNTNSGDSYKTKENKTYTLKDKEL